MNLPGSNSDNAIVAIVTIRNRETSRLFALVNSLRNFGAKCQFLVVDYGSDPGFAAEYKSLAETGLFRLLRMETQGLPWNKCHAINAGVRVTKEPWIATIDVDMVFDCNPFPYCLGRNVERNVQIMQAWFLPPNGNRRRATFGGSGHPGGFVFQSRDAFFEVGAYDESIQFWGLEDWDWVHRLQAVGYKVEWLPEEYRFYHTWHPTANDQSRRPVTASFETALAVTRNRIHPVLDQDWGTIVTELDRPVLGYLDKKDLPTIEIAPGAWVDQFPSLVKMVEAESVVCVRLGCRKERRKLDGLGWMEPVFRILCSPFGLAPLRSTNSNLDYWYATRGLFKELRVVDWYLGPSLDSLTLYREP
jgi:hypothetical protein